MHLRYPAFAAIAWLALAISCQKNNEAPGCGIPATVRDLSRLSGCGYVLDLDNGQRLEPHGEAWENYVPHDGDRVLIGYVTDPMTSICMSGDGAKLTCIEKR